MSLNSQDLKGTPNQYVRLQEVQFDVNGQPPPETSVTNSRNMSSKTQVKQLNSKNNMMTLNSERNERPQNNYMAGNTSNDGLNTQRPPTSQHANGVEQTNQRLDMYNQKQSSLKARLVGSQSQTQQSAATHVGSQQTFSKQEIKQLQGMNKNRELFQMMGRTNTSNTKAYLTSFARKGSAARGYTKGGGGSTSRSRSNSKHRQRSATSKISHNFQINETIRSQNSSVFSNILKNSKKKRPQSKQNRFNMYSDVISNASKAHDDQIQNILIDINMKGADSRAKIITNGSPKKKNRSISPEVHSTKFKIKSQKKHVRQSVVINGQQTTRIQSASWRVKKDDPQLQTQRDPQVRNNDLDMTSENSNQLLPLATNNLIGPGSIISPQNRLAITQSKLKIQTQKQPTFGNLLLNQPSGRTSQKEGEIEEAEKILKQYGRLSGQLYSTSKSVKKPFVEYQAEQMKLNTDSSRGAMQSNLQSVGLLTSVDKAREASDVAESTVQNVRQQPVESEEVLYNTQPQWDEQQSSAKNIGLSANKEDQHAQVRHKLKSVSKKNRRLQINQNSARNQQHQAIYNSSSSPTKLLKGVSSSIIGAPSKVIEGIKKQTQNIIADNNRFKVLIEKNDTKYTATQKSIADMKKKSIQAKSDKVELMRDLATYETNFGESTQMNPRLQKISILLQKALNLFAEETCWKEDHFNAEVSLKEMIVSQDCIHTHQKAPGKKSEHTNSMLNNEQVDSVIATLNMIKGAKRQRVTIDKPGSSVNLLEFSSIALLQNKTGESIESKKLERTATMSDNSGLVSRDTKKRKLALANQLSSQNVVATVVTGKAGKVVSSEDEANVQIIISGISCIVSARNFNGQIKGHISSQKSLKNQKFDMPPTQSMKTHIDVSAEINRLYFGYKKSKHGKDQISLLFKDSIEDSDRIKSFLIRLEGSFTQRQNVDIENVFKSTTCRITIRIKDQVMSEEISHHLVKQDLNNRGVYKDNIELYDIAKYVERCMVYLQRANGQFKLYERHAAKRIYTVDCEILFKAKTNKSQKVRTAATSRRTAGKQLLKRVESKLLGKLKQRQTMMAQQFKKVISKEIISLNKTKQNRNLLGVGVGVALGVGASTDQKSKSDMSEASYLVSSFQSAETIINKIEYNINDVKVQRSKSMQKLPSEKDHELPPISYQLEEELRYSVEHRHDPHIHKKNMQQDYHICNYEERNLWALQIRIRGLQEGFVGDESDSQDEDDQFLEEYDMFYGPRLAKCNKKYTQYKNFKQKQKELDEQKETEMVDIIAEFFEEFNEKITMKDRITEAKNQKPKRKYIRQPKIYQNDYLLQIDQQKLIQEYYSERDELNPQFNILFLFIKEKREHFLMLGRDDYKNSEESSDGKSSSKKSLVLGSEENSNDEEDDDSPYFVKITLDNDFLNHLEDPGLHDSNEIPGQYDQIMKNANFKEIIRRELDLMFGVEKPKKSTAMGGDGLDDSSGDDLVEMEKNSEQSSSDSLSSTSQNHQDTGGAHTDNHQQASPELSPLMKIQEAGGSSGLLDSPGKSLSILANTPQKQSSQDKSSPKKTGSILKKDETNKHLLLEQKLKGKITSFSQILNLNPK